MIQLFLYTMPHGTVFSRCYKTRSRLHGIKSLLRILLSFVRNIGVLQSCLEATGTAIWISFAYSSKNIGYSHIVGVLPGIRIALDVSSIVLVIKNLAGVLLRLFGSVYGSFISPCKHIE